MPSKDHFIALITNALSDRMQAIEGDLDNYLKSGFMPMEREADDEELLAEWDAMPAEQVMAEIQESPSAFLKKWKHMDKLKAKAARKAPPPPPMEMLGLDPLAPYLGPYGMTPPRQAVGPVADPSMAAGPALPPDPSMMPAPPGPPVDPSMPPPPMEGVPPEMMI